MNNNNMYNLMMYMNHINSNLNISNSIVNDPINNPNFMSNIFLNRLSLP